MFINSIFKNFDNLGIKYCHWKSNHFIKESFESRQDFDLLVAKLDRNAFQNILLDHGFKRRISTPDKQYPTMEDFIGMDPNKGTLFHFHVHYALVLGRKYDKNYRIPIETEVFNSVIRHQEYPINIIAPEYELMLLIIRIFLKSKIKLAFIRKNQTFVRKRIFPKNTWSKLHLQIIFYGREYCKARNCYGLTCKICTSCYSNRKKPVITKRA